MSLLLDQRFVFFLLTAMSSYRKPGSTTSSAADSANDSRRRQSKRDDAIRRKIENDLSKRKKDPSRITRQRKSAPGTVLALKPSEPIICKVSTTVNEVSQLMAARRENCILVVNEIGELIGIFTAKDLAFRIVGLGLKATVTIDQIMTPNPMCANALSPALEALSLMVERGFRHLPVLDDNNQIVGVLDITKCYAQQMEKLERLHASSKKLYEALDSVHMEMGGSQEQPQQVFQYFESLKNKMNGPTLENVLESSTIPVYTNVRASVYEATVLMKENRTTAVLVKDLNDEVTGIFTSKDVVLRVIAMGLDPKKCSIVRVMTPQPDVAAVHLPIQQALRQMFEGHYLNLPVVGDDHEIIGIVDVLKLTYATLNQIKQIESQEAEEQSAKGVSEGPAWNKFWTSLDNEDSDSHHSDSVTGSNAPDVTPSEFQMFNVDIKPSDSISHVGAPGINRKALAIFSNVAEDDKVAFTFKFKSPALETRVHRISLRPSEGVSQLRSLIDSKLHNKDYAALRVPVPEEGVEAEKYAVSYIDDEGDVVSITTDADLAECVRINQKLRNDKADLYVHNSHEAVSVEVIQKDIIAGVPNHVLIGGVVGVVGAIGAVLFALKRK